MAQQGLRLLLAQQQQQQQQQPPSACGVAVHAFQAADWALLLSLSSGACQEDYARATALGLDLDLPHGGLDPDPAQASPCGAASAQGNNAGQQEQVQGQEQVPGQQEQEQVQVPAGHVPRVLVPQRAVSGEVVTCSPLPLHFTAARLAVRRKLDGFVAGVLDTYRPTLGGADPMHAVKAAAKQPW